MNFVLSLPRPQVDSLQSDRVQSIARYMNSEGASAEWLTLGLIFIGMASVIFCLKLVVNHNARKQEEALRKRLARNKQSNQAKPTRARARRV